VFACIKQSLNAQLQHPDTYGNGIEVAARPAIVVRLSKPRICKQHQDYEGRRRSLCFVFFNSDTFLLNKQRQPAITMLEIDLARDKKCCHNDKSCFQTNG
jgi:hypothetical protein